MPDIAWNASSGASYQVVANNPAGRFTNSSAAPGALQVWSVTNNPPWNSTGEGASTAYPDAEGMVNLAEYFHGLNPRVAEAASAAVIHTGDVAPPCRCYRVNPGAAGVQSRVDRTADLLAGSWTTNGLSATDLTGGMVRLALGLHADLQGSFARVAPPYHQRVRPSLGHAPPPGSS